MKGVAILCFFVVFVALGNAKLHPKPQSHLMKGLGVPVGVCQQPGDFLPDDTDCTVFYECDEALIPRKFQCDPGLCWSEVLLQCDFFDSADCSRCT